MSFNFYELQKHPLQLSCHCLLKEKPRNSDMRFPETIQRLSNNPPSGLMANCRATCSWTQNSESLLRAYGPRCRSRNRALERPVSRVSHPSARATSYLIVRHIRQTFKRLLKKKTKKTKKLLFPSRRPDAQSGCRRRLAGRLGRQRAAQGHAVCLLHHQRMCQPSQALSSQPEQTAIYLPRPI